MTGEVGLPAPNEADIRKIMLELDAYGNVEIDFEEFEVLIRQVLSNMTNQ